MIQFEQAKIIVNMKSYKNTIYTYIKNHWKNRNEIRNIYYL